MSACLWRRRTIPSPPLLKPQTEELPFCADKGLGVEGEGADLVRVAVVEDACHFEGGRVPRPHLAVGAGGDDVAPVDLRVHQVVTGSLDRLARPTREVPDVDVPAVPARRHEVPRHAEVPYPAVRVAERLRHRTLRHVPHQHPPPLRGHERGPVVVHGNDGALVPAQHLERTLRADRRGAPQADQGVVPGARKRTPAQRQTRQAAAVALQHGDGHARRPARPWPRRRRRLRLQQVDLPAADGAVVRGAEHLDHGLILLHLLRFVHRLQRGLRRCVAVVGAAATAVAGRRRRGCGGSCCDGATHVVNVEQQGGDGACVAAQGAEVAQVVRVPDLHAAVRVACDHDVVAESEGGHVHAGVKQDGCDGDPRVAGGCRVERKGFRHELRRVDVGLVRAVVLHDAHLQAEELRGRLLQTLLAFGDACAQVDQLAVALSEILLEASLHAALDAHPLTLHAFVNGLLGLLLNLLAAEQFFVDAFQQLLLRPQRHHAELPVGRPRQAKFFLDPLVDGQLPDYHPLMKALVDVGLNLDNRVYDAVAVCCGHALQQQVVFGLHLQTEGRRLVEQAVHHVHDVDTALDAAVEVADVQRLVRHDQNPLVHVPLSGTRLRPHRCEEVDHRACHVAEGFEKLGRVDIHEPQPRARVHLQLAHVRVAQRRHVDAVDQHDVVLLWVRRVAVLRLVTRRRLPARPPLVHQPRVRPLLLPDELARPRPMHAGDRAVRRQERQPGFEVRRLHPQQVRRLLVVLLLHAGVRGDLLLKHLQLSRLLHELHLQPPRHAAQRRGDGQHSVGGHPSLKHRVLHAEVQVRVRLRLHRLERVPLQLLQLLLQRSDRLVLVPPHHQLLLGRRPPPRRLRFLQVGPQPGHARLPLLPCTLRRRQVRLQPCDPTVHPPRRRLRPARKPAAAVVA
eukprot:Rhum_TRINITY_DN14767_c17_g2::Rhum_TRINITY_DN14767_c17_g2_i1::g.116936::m.116936